MSSERASRWKEAGEVVVIIGDAALVGGSGQKSLRIIGSVVIYAVTSMMDGRSSLTPSADSVRWWY